MPLDSRRGPAAGLTLVEVLVALAVLIGAGIPLMHLTGEALASERRVRQAEQHLIRADLALAAASLLEPRALAQRIGSRPAGDGLWLAISRPEPALYRLAIRADSATGRELLVTLLHSLEAAP